METIQRMMTLLCQGKENYDFKNSYKRYQLNTCGEGELTVDSGATRAVGVAELEQKR